MVVTENRKIALTVSVAERENVYANLRCAEVVVFVGIPIAVVLLVISVVIVGACELNLDVPAKCMCCIGNRNINHLRRILLHRRVP